MSDPTGNVPGPAWGPPQEPPAPQPEAFVPAGYRWTPQGPVAPPSDPYAGPPPTAPPLPTHVPYSGYAGYQGGVRGTGRPIMRPESVGTVGLIVTAIGAFVVIMGFTVGSWFTSHFGPFHVGLKFSDIADGINAGGLGHEPGRLWFASAYFVFAGWVLFGVALLVGIVSNLDLDASYVARKLSLLIGLLAVVWTCDAAFQPLTESSGTGFSADINPGIGGFLAMGGFGAMFIGSYFSMNWRRVVEHPPRY